MDYEAILPLLLSVLDDGKAVDVVVIDVRGRTSITDYMIVASGNSERHVAALAGHLTEKAKHAGLQVLGVEGLPGGDWVLVDFGDAIVHLMKPQVREFYQLEKFWRGDYAPPQVANA
jgi:ribosome-associated protein